MTYPATLDIYTTVNDGDTITKEMYNTPNDGIEKLMIEVGIDGTAAESVKYKVDNFFISATHVFFAQAAAPTGWTIDSAHKDNVLACKADSGVYSVVGADKGSFSIVTANMPSHTHAIQTGPGGPAGSYINSGVAYGSDKNTVSTGGSDGLYRPKATVGVIATYTGA
jgi:hypothetical protein